MHGLDSASSPWLCSARRSRRRAPSPRRVEAVIAAARDADIVILGEIHDNPEHHRNQAAIMAALQPAALVFEMIPQARRGRGQRPARPRAPSARTIAAALDWAESGWPDFAYYAGDPRGGARRRGCSAPGSRRRTCGARWRRARRRSSARTRRPTGSTSRCRPTSRRRARRCRPSRIATRCPSELLPGMVEAQRFRDAGLADAALWARTMTGDGQVVVIAGSGHADKVARHAGGAGGGSTRGDGAGGRASSRGCRRTRRRIDAILLAPAPERDDPCRQFEEPDTAD